MLNVQPAMRNSRFVSKAMVAEHQRRGAKEALASARALIKSLKLNARTYTAIGEPAATIVAFASKHRCTAIVMGNRGQGRIAGLMLGSVAAKVIYLAKCPVTIVK
jgi:nucleotide-binding universal stress UspA family protein